MGRPEAPANKETNTVNISYPEELDRWILEGHPGPGYPGVSGPPPAVRDSWLPVVFELLDAWTSFRWSKSGVDDEGNVLPGFASKPRLVLDDVKEKFNHLRVYFHLEPPDDGTQPDYLWYESVMEGMVAYAESRVEALEKGKSNGD